MSVRRIGMLAAMATAAAAVACAGHPGTPVPIRGPGYDPQRAALQSWTEDSAILRTGPHRGQMVAFAFQSGCISLVKMEVGQGRICPVRLRRFLPPDSGGPIARGIYTRWRDEPLDEIPDVWSSDTSVVVVAANGALVARQPGSAVIRATVRDARWLTYVTVFPPIESFRWEPTSATLRIGETITLRPMVRDTNGHDTPVNAWVGGSAIWGAPSMVRVDTAPGWREMVVHAVSTGRIEIRAMYGARSADVSLRVLSESEAAAIDKRAADSASALAQSRLPAIRVRVVDDASGGPVVGARVELPAWSLAATSDSSGVASILGARAGTAPLVVRCPWQRRTGPVAATGAVTLRATTDTSLSVAISRGGCVEVDSHAVRGEFTGHVIAAPGGRIFVPCAPFDTLPLPPGVKRQTASVIVADSLLRGKPRVSSDPSFVRWTGVVEGPGPYDDLSVMGSYRFTVIAVGELRPSIVGDCRR